MHPLARAFDAVALLRAAILLALHVQALDAGMPEPVSVLASSLALHVGVTLLEASLAFGLWRIAPSRATAAAICALAFGLCLWSIADPIVYVLAGDHLTPSLLAHFAGFKIFRSDYLWKPVRAYWPLVTVGLASVAVSIAFFARCARSAVRDFRGAATRSSAPFAALGIAAVALPSASGVTYLESPPELLFAVDVAGLHWRPSERDLAALRDVIGLPPGARWLSDSHPLVYAPAPRRGAPVAPPDVVLISIESLRGQDVHLFSGRDDALRLPALETLAASAVVFPHFVSNGFPSTEGFIATSASAWPHPRIRIALERKQTQLDLIGSRFASTGYRTLRVEDDPDFGEEGHWVRRSFDETITFEKLGRLPSEREMVSAIAGWLEQHDRERSRTPVFIDWKTAHPHMPYEVPDDATGRDHSFGSPSANYARSLAYVDAAIGELVVALRSRARWSDTLIFVLGDHSNWLVSTRTTALPSDEMVWTGALLAGSAARIGAPRRVEAPASQVDLLPTLMHLIGDDRPTAALGRDLLADPPTRPPRAVAVRPGGLRLDEEGATLLADRRHLHGAERRCSFAAAGACAGSGDATELARSVDTWGWLVDEDRVFDARWLAPGERRNERSFGSAIGADAADQLHAAVGEDHARGLDAVDEQAVDEIPLADFARIARARSHDRVAALAGGVPDRAHHADPRGARRCCARRTLGRLARDRGLRCDRGSRLRGRHALRRRDRFRRGGLRSSRLRNRTLRHDLGRRARLSRLDDRDRGKRVVLRPRVLRGIDHGHFGLDELHAIGRRDDDFRIEVDRALGGVHSVALA
jgi:hypothetical protein